MEKTVKRIGVVLVAVLCGLFIFRCCMVADTSVFGKPTATDALREAYADGESVLYRHDQTEEIADDGYFAAYAMYYNPESGEVQLAVRYNNSVYDYTYTEEGTEFSFVLENETTGERFPCEIIESKNRSLYRYRRLRTTVTSIDSADQIVAVMLVNDEYESRQVVKYDGQPWKEYAITSSLKKALGVK